MVEHNDDAPLTHLERAMLYYGGDMTPEERAEFEPHLAGCAECQEALEKAREVLPFAEQALAFKPKRTVEEQVQRFEAMRREYAERRTKRRVVLTVGFATAVALVIGAWLVFQPRSGSLPSPKSTDLYSPPHP